MGCDGSKAVVVARAKHLGQKLVLERTIVAFVPISGVQPAARCASTPCSALQATDCCRLAAITSLGQVETWLIAKLLSAALKAVAASRRRVARGSYVN
jgi:hypothetical protein